MKTNIAIVKKPFEIEGDESYDVGSEAIILTAFNTETEYAVASDMHGYTLISKAFFEPYEESSTDVVTENNKNMSADKLMIGDLVIFNSFHHGSNHKVITAVSIISEQDILTEYGHSKGDNLEPIKLTHEILVKNGFVEDQLGYFKIGKGEYNEIYLCEVSYGFVLCCKLFGSIDEYVYLFDCEYVHELQHTLKSFGIKKKIVL